jgi:hypothetical protein
MNEMQMKLRISYDKTHHTSSRANARATLLVKINLDDVG